ncbi:MAG: hypothetical protein U1F56_18825 [Rubrivivax sp.]
MSIAVRPLSAAALALAVLAGPAAAQITPIATRTLVSPPQANANRHFCTVTNVSSQAVPLTRLQIVTTDAVVASATCAGPGMQLGPGQTCTLQAPELTPLGVGLPFVCRAQHQGPEKAVVGAIQSFYAVNGDTRAIGMLPMVAATGISLSP